MSYLLRGLGARPASRRLLRELDGAGGDGSSYDGRALPSGVPAVARGICLLNGTRVSLALSGQLRSGDKHLVAGATGDGRFGGVPLLPAISTGLLEEGRGGGD